jgi:hypothetical protein
VARSWRFISTGVSADSPIICARVGDVAVWDPALNASNSHPVDNWPTFRCSAPGDREFNLGRSWKRTYAWLRTSFPSAKRRRATQRVAAEDMTGRAAVPLGPRVKASDRLAEPADLVEKVMLGVGD